MKTLDDQELTESTFVFFTSDNGPEGDGTKGRTRGVAGGLRGRKRSMYEGGIRVPGIARWPGRIPAGTTRDTPIIGSDLFPTILGVCGVKAPTDRVIDGANVLEVLTGERDSAERPRPLYWRLNMAPPNERLKMALRDGDWKVLATNDFSYLEMYNLKNDPAETTDLKDQEPERFRAMRDRLRDLNDEVEKEGPDWWKRLNPNGGGPAPDRPAR
jgi:arylsulfatase A